ncbi:MULTISPECIES: hypothetical protein [Leptospira]|uniref:hypothetical protein n=1 Tax=Leptospira TaxID=171 RepID=UPI00130110B9|nr:MULTISPECIES: hypothetical protein [Leptospira]
MKSKKIEIRIVLIIKFAKESINLKKTCFAKAAYYISAKGVDARELSKTLSQIQRRVLY